MTRNRTISFLSAAAAVPLAALAIAGCGGNSDKGSTASAATPKSASGRAATVGLASIGGLGKVLVDGHGRTLYLFEKDQPKQSSCTGSCAVAWPPLRDSGKPVAGSGLKSSLLGTAPRSDGKPQVTYDGHPLYLFQGDSKAGDANGQGLNNFGAPWYAVSSSGEAVTSGSNAGGGSGY